MLSFGREYTTSCTDTPRTAVHPYFCKICAEARHALQVLRSYFQAANDAGYAGTLVWQLYGHAVENNMLNGGITSDFKPERCVSVSAVFSTLLASKHVWQSAVCESCMCQRH